MQHRLFVIVKETKVSSLKRIACRWWRSRRQPTGLKQQKKPQNVASAEPLGGLGRRHQSHKWASQTVHCMQSTIASDRFMLLLLEKAAKNPTHSSDRHFTSPPAKRHSLSAYFKMGRILQLPSWYMQNNRKKMIEQIFELFDVPFFRSRSYSLIYWCVVVCLLIVNYTTTRRERKKLFYCTSSRRYDSASFWCT